MEITLIQGIMLAVMAIVVGIDFWLEGFFIFRPIIVCTLTGVILGDVQTGLLAGALTELAFAGLTPVGGTQPPNPILAAIMTTVIACTTGQPVAATIGLALPFSFLMQYIILFIYSGNSLFMSRADRYAKEGNTKAFTRLNCLTIGIVALTYGIVVFLCAYVAQDTMKLILEWMPAWLLHGFEIAGGILPAVGFGMLLRIMLRKNHIPYLIAGFIFACFIPFSNLLPIALMGVAFALFDYFKSDTNSPKIVENVMNKEVDSDEGI